MSVLSSRNSGFKRSLKRRLFGNRDRVKCCFCRAGLNFHEATLEHIKPLSFGGSWDRKNLTLSCADCNHARGTEDFTAFQLRRRNGGKEQAA